MGTITPRPLVTVTICTYNGDRYLASTLDSVLGQTYRNMEVVIVDDGSRDNTLSIIKQYADRDPRIRWFARENAGLAATRNFAFAQAKGSWIAIIDQDDLCYPERLEKQIAIAQERPSAGLIFCGTDYIDETGRVIGNHLSSFKLPKSVIPRRSASNLLLRQGCYVDSEACFIRHSTIDQIGPLDESLRYACDYEYFIRAGFEVDFAYTPEILAAWRIHANQETRTNLGRFNEIRSVLRRYYTHHEIVFATRLVIIQKLLKSFAAEIYYRIRDQLKH